MYWHSLCFPILLFTVILLVLFHSLVLSCWLKVNAVIMFRSVCKLQLIMFTIVFTLRGWEVKDYTHNRKTGTSFHNTKSTVQIISGWQRMKLYLWQLYKEIEYRHIINSSYSCLICLGNRPFFCIKIHLITEPWSCGPETYRSLDPTVCMSLPV